MTLTKTSTVHSTRLPDLVGSALSRHNLYTHSSNLDLRNQRKGPTEAGDQQSPKVTSTVHVLGLTVQRRVTGKQLATIATM